MTTENITSKINNLSSLNPIVIYDGIMEMIFQEEKKADEVVKNKGVLTTLKRVFSAITALFKK